MSKAENNDNKALQIFFIWLLVIGNILTLVGLLLIPNIISNNMYWFTIGGYLFIGGIICTILGLVIMTGISMDLF